MAKGLLERKNVQSDGRIIILQPTDKGLKLEAYLKSTAIETERIMLQGMSPDEQKEFSRLLDIALNNMRTTRGTDSEVHYEYQSRII